MKKELSSIVIVAQLLVFICLESLPAKAIVPHYRLLIQPESTKDIQVDAGQDEEICQGSTIVFAGTASNYTSLLWSTSGNGTFSNPTILNPVYYPTSSETGVVDICLTAFDNNTQATDCLLLTIVPAPEIEPIDDFQVCGNLFQIPISAAIKNAASVYWSVDPDYGFIDDPMNFESVNYYPSSYAIDQGSVLISITAQPINPPCTQSVTQDFIITFIPVPEVFAGVNDTICESNSEFPLTDAWVENESGIEWSTDGDGTFSDPGIQNPIYYPGSEDIATGGAELRILAYSLPGCNALAIMNLSIFPDPHIDPPGPVEMDCAAFDFDAFRWLPVSLEPDVTGAVGFYWTTSGDGTFDEPDQKHTTYELGPASDTWSGSVTLTLTAWGPGSCGVEAVQDFVMNVPQQIIQFPESGTYWTGISSYVDKTGSSAADVFEPLVQAPGSQSVILMKDVFGNFYWPEHEPSIDLLGDWESTGYMAKMKDEGCLPIYGDEPYDTTAHTYIIGPAINFLPVLTNTPVNCDELFADHLEDIRLIYSWHDGNVWTPGPELDPLEYLEPGRAYFLATEPNITPFEICFPDFCLDFNNRCGNNKKSIQKNKWPGSNSVYFLNFYKSHWNWIVPNIASSVALIRSDSIVGIKSSAGQDSIGLFNTDGYCAGTSVYSHDSMPFLIQATSHLYYTDCCGFLVGEPIEMRYYQPESNREFVLDYQYQDFFSDSSEKQNTAFFKYNGFGEFTQLSYRKEIQRIDIEQGWSGISSYLIPEEAGFDSIISRIDTSVVFAHSKAGIYWPAQSINTIGDWDTHSGYVVRLSDNVELEISGHIESDQTLSLPAGWSVIPVLSTCNASTEEVYSQIPQHLIIIKEIAGWRVFWPDLNIKTLDYLMPGKAYLMLADSATDFTFPECSKIALTNQVVNPDFHIPGWSPVQATPASHLVGIPSETLWDGRQIKPDDIIGAFDGDGKCCGMQKVSSENVSLMVFGDDEFTKAKDGFYEAEEISFRLYRPSTYESHDLSVVFSMDYPDYNGKFKDNGISVIKNVKVASSGNSEAYINLLLDVFPVPSTNQIELSIVLPEKGRYLYRIISTNGRLIHQHAFNPQAGLWHEKIDISGLPAGSYFIRLLNTNGIVKGKAAFVKTR